MFNQNAAVQNHLVKYNTILAKTKATTMAKVEQKKDFKEVMADAKVKFGEINEKMTFPVGKGKVNVGLLGATWVAFTVM